jgi:acyl carrier protein
MPAPHSLLALVNHIRAHRNGAAVPELDPAARLREDLGLDSIDLAELTARIDHEFGVDVFADGVVGTVGEVLDRIEKGSRHG